MAALGLVVAQNASAALTFGADLNQTPNTDLGHPTIGEPISGVQEIDSDGASELGSPIAGVVVSARVKTLSNDPNPNLVIRLLDPLAAMSYFNLAPEIPIPVLAHAVGTVTEVGGLHHPVSVGDQLGIGTPKQDNFSIAVSDAQSSTRIPAVQSGHPPGTAITYASSESKELLVAATVEPDADADGFGDESQDGCPTNPSAQGPCPSPAGSASVPGSRKCKKGFRLRKVKTKSGKKKRKCVRKKKRRK